MWRAPRVSGAACSIDALTQLGDPSRDLLVITREGFVALERLEGWRRLVEIEIQHHREIAVRGREGRIRRDRALMRSGRIAETAKHPQRDAQFSPGHRARGISLGRRTQRLFGAFEIAGLAAQQADVDLRTCIVRIRNRELAELELGLRRIAAARERHGTPELCDRARRIAARRRPSRLLRHGLRFDRRLLRKRETRQGSADQHGRLSCALIQVR
jgi:hypothetical protein